MTKRPKFGIYLLIDGKRVDFKESVEVCVTSDRLEEGVALNVRFTEEGILADLLNKDGAVVKSFANMYDEFEELMI